MGCTTSASSVYTPDANATGKHIKFTEELKEETSDVEQITTKVQDEKVLPTCDKLAETIQLAKNNNNENSLKHSMSTIDIAKVCQSTENEIMEADCRVDDKISSLEEVVEKVIEINNFDSHEEITYCDLSNETDTPLVEPCDSGGEASDKVMNNSEKEHIINKTSEDENRSNEPIEEFVEEATSPSQSESSRATRWEALADIAAELPPSLAVDPITGQIYSLTK